MFTESLAKKTLGSLYIFNAVMTGIIFYHGPDEMGSLLKNQIYQTKDFCGYFSFPAMLLAFVLSFLTVRGP